MTNLNEYIKSLSIKDKKTLSQKALKTCEEVGELAKAILPFDSAPGTNHIFIDREKILEEIADVYLTNISIAYSLNFNDEEIYDMIQRKAMKWHEIQSKEEKATFPLPFEIHITVDLNNVKDKTYFVNQFKESCKSLCLKPIVIEFQLENGTIEDVMTSSKHFGDNRSAYEESERISTQLKSLGYNVIRKKIETVPWHSAAPIIDGVIPIPNDCYFESHIGVVIIPEQKDKLQNYVNFLNESFEDSECGGVAKLSQNFFKKSEDGSKFINMITYRNNLCGYDTFKDEVELIKLSLMVNEFEFEKVEIEYAIYDSNIHHDDAWISEKLELLEA
jgi:NTP pyrophosphatase (non-canonical NTP hydrolase)